MAAQEALHSLHSPQYVKTEPSSNGYSYHYMTNEGSYPNHYNPYLHYGDPMSQHQLESPHSYESLGQQHSYPPPGANPEDSHMHYAQPHMGSLNPYGHHMIENDSMQHRDMHPSHYNMMGAPNHGLYKEEPMEDPYSFVDEDPMLHRGSMPVAATGVKAENSLGMSPFTGPKKRGRKKKVQQEVENGEGVLSMEMMPINPDGQPMKRKYTKSEHYKQRRRHDRFNGMSEEEVRSRTLPDHLTPNLDVVIIGINPGLFAAYKGHHYAGPGNHFWKCLYLAGLVPEPMTADDDFKLLHYGIGFTNMVARATKGSADLTRKEIREGGRILLEKLQKFRPKIAVFNGKGIYEVFSGKKEFTFGKQPEYIDGTNTYIWVMPSSSARCAQLPRAMDKVPFYAALKKFRDYLNGLIPEIDDSEVVFNDPKIRAADDGTEISEHLKEDLPGAPSYSGDVPVDERNGLLPDPLNGGSVQIPVVKKKRGRPKKIRTEETNVAKPEFSNASTSSVPNFNGTTDFINGGPPKKKRGRPKKIRVEDIYLPQLDMNGSLSSNGGSSTNQSELGAPRPSSLSPAPYMNQSNSSTQSNPLTTDFYGQSPSMGGPLSGLCNDAGNVSPRQPTSSHDHPLGSPSPSSPPLPPPDFDVPTNSAGNGTSTSAATPVSTGGATPASIAVGPASSGSQIDGNNPDTNSDRDNSFNQFNTPTSGSSSSSSTSQQQQPTQQQQQQPQQQQQSQPPPAQQQPPPNLQSNTPQPINYRPAPPNSLACTSHNQDVASKSLSGLESLVDQIPNIGSDGEHAIHLHHHNQLPPNTFSHYSTAQSNFTYSSPSFGHYAPHLAGGTVPGFTSHLPYSQGSQNPPLDHGFSGSNSAYPNLMSSSMFGPSTSTSSMNGPLMGLGHSMGSFSYPYSQYPASATSFPYSTTAGVGLHPVHNNSYAYPPASVAYTQNSYTQAGYLNNQVLDRLKQDRMDSGYGGY